MSLMEKVRVAIQERRIPPIFNSGDLKAEGIKDPNNNLSNYDKKNRGAKNKKVLVSREISGVIFYTFDEQLFDEEY